MSCYYLVASLPELRMDFAPPFSAEEFCAKCHGVLPDAEVSDLQIILGLNEGTATTEPARSWQEFEMLLVREIASVRAEFYEEDLKLVKPYSGIVEPAVAHIFTLKNPGERDRELDAFRWRKADELAQEDAFGFAAVAAFAAKLKIAQRRAALKKADGENILEKLVAQTTDIEI